MQSDIVRRVEMEISVASDQFSGMNASSVFVTFVNFSFLLSRGLSVLSQNEFPVF